MLQNFGYKQIREADIAAKVKWNAMTLDARQPYCIKSESHDALFPIKKDNIITKFDKDTNMMYEHASNEIDSWCVATTILSLLEGHISGTSTKNFSPKSQQNSKNAKEVW